MIETARKEDLFLDKKLIIPENRLDAIRIMARLHPVVGDQPTNEKDQPNTNNPVLDLACTILNIHESGVGVHADLRKIQNEPPKYFYGKGFMSGISSLKGNGILAVYGQWNDASGRYAIKQFYYTDKEILWRNAVSDTAWSAWFDVLTGNSDLDYNKLLNVPLTSTLSDDKTKIASIFAVNNVNRAAVNAQKTANTANANAVAAMNEAKKKVEPKDVKTTLLRDAGGYFTTSYDENIDDWVAGDNGLLTNDTKSIPKDVRDLIGGGGFVHVTTEAVYSSNLGNKYQFIKAYRKPEIVIRVKASDGGWTSALLLSSYNTTVGNHGQLHSGKVIPKDLLAVGDFGIGSSNIAITNGSIFDVYKSGFYRQLDSNVYPTTLNNNIILHGYSTERMSGILQMPIANRAWLFNSNTKTFDEIYSTANTTTDPSGFLRSFGNAVALTTDKLTSDLKVNRSDLVASAKYAYDVYQAALAADKKAANAQARADSAFSKVKPISEGGTGATTAANARKNLGHGDASTRNVATSLDSNGNTLVPLSLIEKSIGYDQKWVNVSAQRIKDKAYLNDTGRPIQVLITTRETGNNEGIWIDQGSGFIQVSRASAVSAVAHSLIIPPGAHYKCGANNIFWSELR